MEYITTTNDCYSVPKSHSALRNHNSNPELSSHIRSNLQAKQCQFLCILRSSTAQLQLLPVQLGSAQSIQKKNLPRISASLFRRLSLRHSASACQYSQRFMTVSLDVMSDNVLLRHPQYQYQGSFHSSHSAIQGPPSRQSESTAICLR